MHVVAHSGPSYSFALAFGGRASNLHRSSPILALIIGVSNWGKEYSLSGWEVHMLLDAQIILVDLLSFVIALVKSSILVMGG